MTACLAFALCSQRSAAGGVYVAFNTSHRPVTVQLPQWWERLWLPVFDSSKVTCECRSELRLLPAVRSLDAGRTLYALWHSGGFQAAHPEDRSECSFYLGVGTSLTMTTWKLF